MKFSKKTLLLILVAVLIVVGGILVSKKTPAPPLASPYIGQENRQIKALSQEEIDGLLAGAGTPLGGMAKPAELNGYPGPRHVLDGYRAGKLKLTDGQVEKIDLIYAKMQTEAINLGKKFIETEQAIDNAFVTKTIDQEFLSKKLEESSNIYRQLRLVHLKNHLYMMDILTPEQIEEYNQLRGYTLNASDPCLNIPEGHDAEIWKRHNNCEN